MSSFSPFHALTRNRHLQPRRVGFSAYQVRNNRVLAVLGIRNIEREEKRRHLARFHFLPLAANSGPGQITWC